MFIFIISYIISIFINRWIIGYFRRKDLRDFKQGEVPILIYFLYFIATCFLVIYGLSQMSINLKPLINNKIYKWFFNQL
jgi:hypothetical protein